jgi:hypothetical protein
LYTLACVGTGGSATASVTIGVSAPPTTPPPVPTQATATLRVTSASGGSALPFSAGYAFKQGQVPSGKFVSASGAGLRGFQAAVKNRWRDGSVKYAVLSGLIDLEANVQRSLTIGAADTGTADAALGLGDLKSTGASVSIAYDVNGTVSWANTDWDTPFLTWISGPQMSSWIYRKPLGGDQHLVAWLEVRLYRGGAVEFLPWLENGYLLRASPGERSGIATLTINGSSRFSSGLILTNHTRAVLADGPRLSHWLGSDPGISFKHDMPYLQSTGLVPAYRGVTAANASLFGALATSYAPFAQANYPTSMGNAGYHPSIGPLPEWDVVYMTSDGDLRAWRAVQINGYASGRYGFHFRDETTNRAPRFSAHPNLVLGEGSGISDTGASSTSQYTPNSSGGTPARFANTHMPAIGFMAYLVTGRWYFVDEMQLLSSAMFLKQTDTNRNFSRGILQSSVGSNSTRGAAWTIRALTHAAAMTPDDDQPMKSELIGSVQFNIDWYHARYVAQPNNPLGLCAPYSDYSPGDGKSDSAIWMEDFLTWAFGNVKSMQVYDSSFDAKVDQFLSWKYRSIVGRFGPNEAGNWSYRDAAAYTVPYAPSETANYSDGTGPWYPNWGASYVAAGLSYASGTTLQGGNFADDGLATSYWGNLQPALAYAVEHGAAGALEAYQRMVGASNWSSGAAAYNTVTPVWGVKPRNLTN